MNNKTTDSLTEEKQARLAEYLGLRIPRAILAKLFNVSLATIHKYARKLAPETVEETEEKSMPNFRSLVTAYATLLGKQEYNHLDERLKSHLWHHISHKEFAATLMVLRAVSGAKPLKGYDPDETLVMAVFGGVGINVEGVLRSQTELLVKRVAAGELKCKSIKELTNMVHQEVLVQLRQGQWAFYVSPADREAIREVLCTLTPREEDVIRKRFGIDRPAMNQDEVGLTLDPPVSRERVRQIEAKALRKLRHPTRSRKFAATFREGLAARFSEAFNTIAELEKDRDELFQTNQALEGTPLVKRAREERSSLHSQIEALRAEITELQRRLPIPPEGNQNLMMTIDEFGFSIRAYNALVNLEIKDIRELVEKTESELLKSKNFGRKSLNEIKEVLASMGLSLGMELAGDDA